ncbi:unnamed protein product [Oikopleura dioica]|uniref:RING-type domain-containing protein n=1 Tax=Oikopleura dioica TaxID=34765 RepID=E4YUX9_OIKDI|nr:unnamed protein product [Oikopleura dioica]
MGQEINEDHMEEHLRNLKYFDMKRKGELTLEAVAGMNEPDAVELIQELLRSGANPMEQDSQKLFPYHFAKNKEVFEALTPPPIDRRSYLLTLARSILTEDAKYVFLKNLVDNSIPFDTSFSGQDNLTCIGIAAQRGEYYFAQNLGLFMDTIIHSQKATFENTVHNLVRQIVEKDNHIKLLEERQKAAPTSDESNIYQFQMESVNKSKLYVAEKCKNARLSSEMDKMKVDHKVEIEKYEAEIEKLKKEAAGNFMLEDEELKRKLDIAVERIGILAFENDVLKDDSCKKEELLKAEILNLNKCISRQKAKCADLSTENDKLKKESAIFTNKESESKKENENLKIEIDMLKGDADLQKVQLENSINELQDENQQLLGRLKGVRTIKMQAQEHIRQLNELFDIENSSQSEIRVKELEDQIAALKTVNTDLESISKKFEQVTSCSLCDEKYESTGKQAPVKLKCRHVFCSHCATNWLKSQGNKSSCPACREPYRSEDIRFVYLNTDL